MRFSNKTICMLVLSFLVIPGITLKAADPVPLDPLRVYGVVGFENNLYRSVSQLYMNLNVSRGGEPVSGLEVKFQGMLAEEGAGGYGKQIHGVVPAVNEALSVSIQKRPLLPHVRVDGIAASSSFSSLFHITAPANGEHVPSTLPDVEIRWAGGLAPYHVTVYRLSPPRKDVFKKSGIAGTSCRVPMRFLAPGEYLVSLRSDDMGRFKFKGVVTADSEIKLRQIEIIHIFVD